MQKIIGIIVIGLGIFLYMLRKEYAEFTYKRQQAMRKSGQVDHEKWTKSAMRTSTIISLAFVVIGAFYGFLS